MKFGPSFPALSREEILSALAQLNSLLAEQNVVGELCLFGGTVMVLVFNARLSTRDVDAIFQPAPVIRELAGRIAAERGWSNAWLNDGVKGFVSDRPELTPDSLPQFTNLRLLRPSAEYLLAMKCMAARAEEHETSGDGRDITALIRHLNLTSIEEVESVVMRFFPPERILPKTQFIIHEIISGLSKTA